MDLSIIDEDEPPPTEEDCCNSGCSQCVFDIYEKSMEEKKKKKKKEKERKEEEEEEECRYDLLSQTTFKPFILLERSDFGECYSRLTFQPIVPKTETVENDSENIISEGKNGLENMISSVKKGFEIILDETKTSGCMNNSEEQVNYDNMTVEESYNIVREQRIYGYLPYKPGQHLTMKSWRVKNIGEPNNVTNQDTRGNQEDQKSADIKPGEESEVMDQGLPLYLISKEAILRTEKPNSMTRNYKAITLSPNQSLPSYSISKEAIMGFENPNFINVDPNSPINSVSKEAIMGSETPNFIAGNHKSITLSQNQSSPLNSVSNEANMGSENPSFINIDPKSPINSVSRKAILGTVKLYSNTRDYKPITLSQIQNSPPNSISKEANMGSENPNLINIDPKSPINSVSREAILGTVKLYSNTRAYKPITLSQIQNSPPNSISKEANMGPKTLNLINLDQDSPSNSISKETIMRNGKPNFITRDYTPISLASCSSNCRFQIVIKYYEDGEMSKYLKSLKNGDKVHFRGPYGDFRYLKNHNHILAICMGTGIAPIYAIFRTILDDETDETFIRLLYGCKDTGSIILRNKLGEMAKYWNFGAEFYLTSGTVQGGAKFGENFRVGRIQKNCVYENLKPKQLVLVCGSAAFNSEIVGYLAEFDGWKVEYFVF